MFTKRRSRDEVLSTLLNIIEQTPKREGELTESSRVKGFQEKTWLLTFLFPLEVMFIRQKLNHHAESVMTITQNGLRSRYIEPNGE